MPGAEPGASAARNPMGRVGRMEELQNLATFLMSDGCEWLSGETIAMDGAEALATGGNFYELRPLGRQRMESGARGHPGAQRARQGRARLTDREAEHGRAGAMRSWKLTQFKAPLAEVIEGRRRPRSARKFFCVSEPAASAIATSTSLTAISISATARSWTSRLRSIAPRLGHEIVGVVEDIGPEATDVRVGDRRAIYAWGGCGQCAQCRAEREESVRSAA